MVNIIRDSPINHILSRKYRCSVHLEASHPSRLTPYLTLIRPRRRGGGGAFHGTRHKRERTGGASISIETKDMCNPYRVLFVALVVVFSTSSAWESCLIRYRYVWSCMWMQYDSVFTTPSEYLYSTLARSLRFAFVRILVGEPKHCFTKTISSTNVTQFRWI